MAGGRVPDRGTAELSSSSNAEPNLDAPGLAG